MSTAFSPEAMADAKRQIEARHLDMLMNGIVKFAREAGMELQLNDNQVANALASACALHAVNLNAPKGIDRPLFDQAMKEAIPRLYDAMFSLRDWLDRKVPWRMQSTHMKTAHARIINDLNTVNDGTVQ